jgi:MSHA pilin protein MshA
MRANDDQGGLTLTEIVVVVAILGILASFAVPRVIALDTQARLSAQQALVGSVRSAAALSHALWLAQGQPTTVMIDDRKIAIVNGYPNLATIHLALSDFTDYTYAAATGVFARSSGPTCAVTYVQAAANGAPGVTPSAGTC